MALTVGEANDVNTLLRYVLNLPGVLGVIPTSDQAREAAGRLADKAHKGLMAGLDSDDVNAAWPNLLLDNNGRTGEPVGPPYTVEGCEHCAGCGEVAWECVCEATAEDDDTMPCGCQEGMHYCENPGRRTPPPSFEDREAQAAYDDEWIGRRS